MPKLVELNTAACGGGLLTTNVRRVRSAHKFQGPLRLTKRDIGFRTFRNYREPGPWNP